MEAPFTTTIRTEVLTLAEAFATELGYTLMVEEAKDGQVTITYGAAPTEATETA